MCVHLKYIFSVLQDTYVVYTGKGNTSDPRGLIDVIEAGAAGLKLHEDWGTVSALIYYHYYCLK